MILALGRGVYVEGLTLVLRLGVGQVTVDFRLPGEQRGGEEQKGDDGSHADFSQ
jgi:hypothetical protein